MAENLRVTHYRGGITEPIIDGNEVGIWTGNTTGAYCDYEKTKTNGPIYGHLYNWYAVANTNSKKIAPAGWHIPSTTEFETLYKYLNNNNALTNQEISNALREKGTAHWVYPNAATNSTGFTALPGGERLPDGTFKSLTILGTFWSSTDYLTGYAYRSNILSDDFYWQQGWDKKAGLSIRCIKD